MRTPNQIESLARQLLTDQGVIKRPVDVKTLAKKLGVHVRYQIADDDVSGALFRDSGDGTPIIGVNALHAPARQSFTIAHEIGHLRLHHDQLHVDHSLSHVLPVASGLSLRALRKTSSRPDRDPKEVEANRFAASLLMPAHFLVLDLKPYDGPLKESDVVTLAGQYGVSTQAMAFRLINLGAALEYAQA